MAARAQAVVCTSTSPARTARCARALAAAGFSGPRLGLEAALHPDFLTAAGSAAEGWVFEASYCDPASAGTERAKAFTAAYRKKYGRSPGRWAAEAYDAVGLIAATVDALGDCTGIEPGRVAERVFRITYDGVAKRLSLVQDTRTLSLLACPSCTRSRTGSSASWGGTTRWARRVADPAGVRRV